MTTHALERHGAGLIRGPRKADQGYLASTFVRSMSGVAHRSLGARGGEIARQIDRLLDRPDCRALIRHAPGDQDRIMGWCLHIEGPGVPVIAYVYTRNEHRNKGIASSLLSTAGVRVDQACVYLNNGPDSRVLRAAYPLAQYLSMKEFLA